MTRNEGQTRRILRRNISLSKERQLEGHFNSSLGVSGRSSGINGGARDLRAGESLSSGAVQLAFVLETFAILGADAGNSLCLTFVSLVARFNPGLLGSRERNVFRTMAPIYGKNNSHSYGKCEPNLMFLPAETMQSIKTSRAMAAKTNCTNEAILVGWIFLWKWIKKEMYNWLMRMVYEGKKLV